MKTTDKELNEKWSVWRVETRANGFGPGYWIDHGVTGGRDAEYHAIKSEQARNHGVSITDIRLVVVL